MHGLMPFDSARFFRHQADGASGGEAPQADTKPEDATGSDKAEVKTLTQAQVDAIVAERLERERKRQERAQAEAAKAEADKRLEEQREFEKLATARKAEVDDLAAKLKVTEAAGAQLERATKALEAYRDAQFGALPEEIRELLTGRDVVDQLEWLTKYGARVATVQVPADAGKKGGGTPSPTKGRAASQGDSAADLIARKKAQLGIA